MLREELSKRSVVDAEQRIASKFDVLKGGYSPDEWGRMMKKRND